MTWRWRADAGDFHLDVDDMPWAMLCPHHDDFWTTVVNGDRQDFRRREDAIARIAIDLHIPDLTAPADAPDKPGEILVGSARELLRKGVNPAVIAEAAALERKSS